MPRPASLPFVALIACLAAACSVSEEQEADIGRSTAAQVDSQLLLVSDPGVVDYVQALGKRLALRTSRANLDWRFAVVDSREVNAFALPGGYIYVNRGLIERTEHMDQLAGALGHEIGHVVRRHSAEQMERAGGANVGLALLCTLTNVCESRAARVAIDVGGSAWLARHSRADEAEADSEAVAIVVRADISPEGIPELFRILLAARRHQPDRLESFFASHPLEEERIERTEGLVEAIDPALRRDLARDDAAYAEFRRRLAALPDAPAGRRSAPAPARDSRAPPAPLRR
jgi:predicted Zn-dependent protease